VEKNNLLRWQANSLIRKYPMASIVGNDISAIQPNWVSPNVEFVVEDFESEWIYEPSSFDFIHARLLAGSVIRIFFLVGNLLIILQLRFRLASTI
jgi:hypothetical protein